MPKFVNRAYVSTATTGTGTITLGSPVDGYQSFAAAGLSNGDLVTYVIEAGNAWEIGLGLYSSSGPTLTRSLVQSSTGTLLNLSGSAKVFVTASASDIMNTDSPVIASGVLTEDVNTITGTSVPLVPTNGSVQTHTLSGNTAYSDGLSDGQAITLMIDDGAGFTVTWPTITWVNNGGSAPTLATAGYTVIALWKVSTTLYGALVGDGS